MSIAIRRAFAASAITLFGITGVAAPAQADPSAPGCDPAAVTAALDQARADARTAQKAFTTHTKSSMQALVKQVKAEEKAEARAADTKADRLAAKAIKDKTLRDEAKAARKVARAEAKEAAKVERASRAELRAMVKVERKTLKEEWDVAKDALQALRAHAEACEEAPAEEPGTEG